MSQVQNYCYQRQLKMLFNTPSQRFELVSPYTSKQFTKDQLDMRRKAEVLKRSSPPSTGGSKGNALTKAQKFALLVRGSLPNVTTTNVCDNVSTPSSSSDVPGPILMLYEDASIPVYNFAAPTRTYAIIEKNKTNAFVFHVSSDTVWMSQEKKRIGVLEIVNIDSEYLMFSLAIPLSHSMRIPTLNITYSQVLVTSVQPTIFVLNNTLYITNIKLSTVNGYFYEWFLTATDSFTVSSSSSVQMISS
jgi:hypothetical protein